MKHITKLLNTNKTEFLRRCAKDEVKWIKFGRALLIGIALCYH